MINFAIVRKCLDQKGMKLYLLRSLRCSRYVQINYESSSFYSKYDKSVPEFLHNRPKPFVRHCLKKIIASEEVRHKNITIVNESSNVYKVLNPYTEAEYEVTLNVPRCSCKDFLLTNLPCKHFFAVMKCFENVSWETIPSNYRSSPFIALDFDAIFENESLQDKRSLPHNIGESSNFPTDFDEIATSDLHRVDNDGLTQDAVQELPKRKEIVLKSKGAACREVLKEIRSLTYLISDVNVLDCLLGKLRDVHNDLRDQADSEEGLILESSSKNTASCGSAKSDKRALLQVNQTSKESVTEIPTRKSRKRVMTGRVGEAADKVRRSKYLKITDDTVNTEAAVEEDDLLATENVESFFAEKMEMAEEEHSSNDRSETIDFVEIEYDGAVPDSHRYSSKFNTESTSRRAAKKRKTKSSQMSSQKRFSKQGRPKVDPSDDEIIYSGSIPPHENPSRPTLRNVMLGIEDVSTIENDQMLTDFHVNYSQQMLRLQFPDYAGLEDTSRGIELKFSVFRGKYIQILHDGNLHWVCFSNVFRKSASDTTVDYYDSLNNNGRISPKVLRQIAQLSFCKEESLKICIKPVHQQTNMTNCGVFAIAFATCIASGFDPVAVRFDEKAMRSHLVACIRQKELLLFPVLEYTPVQRPERNCSIELYCECRLPYDRRSKDPRWDMKQCMVCKKWYHRSCQNISSIFFTDSDVAWKCTLCE